MSSTPSLFRAESSGGDGIGGFTKSEVVPGRSAARTVRVFFFLAMSLAEILSFVVFPPEMERVTVALADCERQV